MSRRTRTSHKRVSGRHLIALFIVCAAALIVPLFVAGIMGKP